MPKNRLDQDVCSWKRLSPEFSVAANDNTAQQLRSKQRLCPSYKWLDNNFTEFQSCGTRPHDNSVGWCLRNIPEKRETAQSLGTARCPFFQASDLFRTAVPCRTQKGITDTVPWVDNSVAGTFSDNKTFTVRRPCVARLSVPVCGRHWAAATSSRELAMETDSSRSSDYTINDELLDRFPLLNDVYADCPNHDIRKATLCISARSDSNFVEKQPTVSDKNIPWPDECCRGEVRYPMGRLNAGVTRRSVKEQECHGDSAVKKNHKTCGWLCKTDDALWAPQEGPVYHDKATVHGRPCTSVSFDHTQSRGRYILRGNSSFPGDTNDSPFSNALSNGCRRSCMRVRGGRFRILQSRRGTIRPNNAHMSHNELRGVKTKEGGGLTGRRSDKFHFPISVYQDGFSMQSETSSGSEVSRSFKVKKCGETGESTSLPEYLVEPEDVGTLFMGLLESPSWGVCEKDYRSSATSAPEAIQKPARYASGRQLPSEVSLSEAGLAQPTDDVLNNPAITVTNNTVAPPKEVRRSYSVYHGDKMTTPYPFLKARTGRGGGRNPNYINLVDNYRGSPHYAGVTPNCRKRSDSYRKQYATTLRMSNTFSTACLSSSNILQRQNRSNETLNIRFLSGIPPTPAP